MQELCVKELLVEELCVKKSCHTKVTHMSPNATPAIESDAHVTKCHACHTKDHEERVVFERVVCDKDVCV